MPKEKSAGAVVYRIDSQIKYLLLYRKAQEHYTESWDFPKGKIEANEDEIEAAKREVREETGVIDLEFANGFKEGIHYYYKKGKDLMDKEVVYFLAKTNSEKIRVSEEHNDIRWVAYDEAMKLLTHENSRKILKKANTFILK